MSRFSELDIALESPRDTKTKIQRGCIGSWMALDECSLWRVEQVCSAGQWFTIQSLNTGEQQTIHPEEFWLLLDSL